MEALKKNKILLSVFGVTLIIFIYVMFFTGGGDSSESESNTTDTVSSVNGQTKAGQEILSILAQLEAVRIDTTLFSSPSWLSLRNFQVTLPSNYPGKEDLFAPIGQ